MKYDREAGHFRVKFIELVLLRMQKKKKREKEEKERRRKERNISKLFQRCISDIARHIIFLKRDLPFKSRQDRRIVQFTSTGD